MRVAKMAPWLVVALIAGGIAGYYLSPTTVDSLSRQFASARSSSENGLPADLLRVLNRFTMVNRATNQVVEEFTLIGTAEGVYEKGGEIFETYVVGFEDRYGGAEADNDFLDILVEFKRARGSGHVTVRVVQLGFDTIDVYLDGEILGSVRPTIEVRIDTRT